MMWAVQAETSSSPTNIHTFPGIAWPFSETVVWPLCWILLLSPFPRGPNESTKSTHSIVLKMFTFIYLKGRARERGELVYSPNACNSQAGAGSSLESETPSTSCMWVAGAQPLEPTSDASQAHWQDARWKVVRTQTFWYEMWPSQVVAQCLSPQFILSHVSDRQQGSVWTQMTCFGGPLTSTAVSQCGNCKTCQSKMPGLKK